MSFFAYKAFHKDWRCRGMQYHVGGEFKIEGAIKPCEVGIHACYVLVDCFHYYASHPSKTRLAIVEILGDVVQQKDKLVTNHIRIVREIGFDEIPTIMNGKHTIPGVSDRWYKNGELSRDDDLPAEVHADGMQVWCQDGRRHRDNDKPALVYPNGSKEWYQYGRLHRDNDKPAVVDADGYKEWYQNGERHRDGDLPAVIASGGIQEWFKDGRRHRDNDKPAVVHADGTQMWYKRGQLHRDADKPAVVYASGKRKWYKQGRCRAVADTDSTLHWEDLAEA